MSNIGVTLSVAIVIFGLERFIPDTALPSAQHWYRRAFIFNAIQALVAATGVFVWDRWFASIAIFNIADLALALQVLVGYFTITFIYYWWHRARHSIPSLWRILHQFHHSPARIEVITSFYKHPLEVVLNGILSSAILYLLLGLPAQAVGLCVLVTALAELFYHMNIKTPQWLGLFFQRPEMHRLHHQRHQHHYNYSDLPIWDMLFGTYNNPAVFDGECGFPDNNETRLQHLLCARKVTS